MDTLKSAVPHIIALLSLAVSIATATLGNNLSILAWTFATITFLAIIAGFLIDRRIIHGNITKIKSIASNKHKIQEYMHDLIRGASSVAIFTKDMSWTNEEIESILTAKARSGSLVLALAEPTQLSQRLLIEGAAVYYYGGKLDEPLRARFTLINLDSQSLELAIGRTSGSTHTIYRYSNNSDSPLLLANELLRILRTLPAATIGSSTEGNLDVANTNGP